MLIASLRAAFDSHDGNLTRRLCIGWSFVDAPTASAKFSTKVHVCGLLLFTMSIPLTYIAAASSWASLAKRSSNAQSERVRMAARSE